MSQINVRNLSNENEDGAPDIVGVSTFSATSYFVPPVGTTAQRPDNPQGGDLRFNTDTASLEYFKGDTIGWSQIEMTSPDLGVKNEGLSGARGFHASGGPHPSSIDVIEFITIPTLGNGTDFGNTTYNATQMSNGVSSRTRGIFAGGYAAGRVNTITYITMSSSGDAIDFGDMTQGREGMAGGSNGTRGIMCAGWVNPAGTNIIDYITIAATGNSVDFGDNTQASNQNAGVNSSTRMVVRGANNNTISYITMATTGNAQDFGDFTAAVDYGLGGVCNSTRGIFGGGHPGSGALNTLQYITIATLGNGADFGDLTSARRDVNGVSSPTRGCWLGGTTDSSPYPDVNTIDYVEILTTGNAVDFGDLTTARKGGGACDNAHGGL